MGVDNQFRFRIWIRVCHFVNKINMFFIKWKKKWIWFQFFMDVYLAAQNIFPRAYIFLRCRGSEKKSSHNERTFSCVGECLFSVSSYTMPQTGVRARPSKHVCTTNDYRHIFVWNPTTSGFVWREQQQEIGKMDIVRDVQVNMDIPTNTTLPVKWACSSSYLPG